MHGRSLDGVRPPAHSPPIWSVVPFGADGFCCAYKTFSAKSDLGSANPLATPTYQLLHTPSDFREWLLSLTDIDVLVGMAEPSATRNTAAPPVGEPLQDDPSELQYT
jgi:hypothetical protein